MTSWSYRTSKKAAEVLADVWADHIIDNHPVTAVASFDPVPVEPVERFRRNRQGHHIICSPPLWLDQSNKELWLAVECRVTSGRGLVRESS